MRHLLLSLFFFLVLAGHEANAQFRIEGPETICTGPSATLSAIGCAGTLRWSTGETTASITIRTAVSYTDYVTCTIDSTSTTASISYIYVPKVQITADGSTCVGDGTTLSIVGASANTRARWRKDGVIIPNLNGTTYAPTLPGAYTAEMQADAWAQQFPLRSDDQPYDFRSLDFVNRNVGWVGNVLGSLLKTSNGGSVWLPMSLQKVYAQDFLDESTGYAVAKGTGSSQAIHKSTDGGISWTEQLALPDSGQAIMQFVDNNTGWVSNGTNKLYRTINGGMTWNQVALGYNVASLFFLDASTGWLGTNYSRIAKTSDGGLTWQVVFSGYRPVQDIYFKDPNEGWASDGFESRKTTDGGLTWSYALYSDFPVGFGGMAFANANFGIALVGSFGFPQQGNFYYKTYNGGASWSRHSLSLPDSFQKIKLADATRGWAISKTGKILYYSAPEPICSSNVLTLVASPATPLITANPAQQIYCAGNSTTLTASGCSGSIQWSTGASSASITVTPGASTLYTVTCTAADGCQSQANYSQGVLPQLQLSSNGPACAAANVKLTANGNGISATDLIWKRDGIPVSRGTNIHFADLAGTYTVEDTATQGTWLPYASASGGQPHRRLSFVDEEKGWAIAGIKTLLKTTDGGSNWIRQPDGFNLGTYDGLTDVEFKTATLGWVSSRTEIFKTTDAGQSWTSQYANPNIELSDVFFLDNQQGWAAGKDRSFGMNRGIVLKTTDGGNTWQVATVGQYYEDNPIKEVFFVSAAVGWVISDNGYGSNGLYKSTDGGVTWQLQTLPPVPLLPTTSLTCLYFEDSMRGWVGRYESLFRTMDGGATWSDVSLPNTEYLVNVPYAVKIDSGRGWALSKVAAYFTADNGQSWTQHPYDNGTQSPNSSFFFSSGKILTAGSAGRLTKFVPKTTACSASITIQPAPSAPVVVASSLVVCAGESITLTGSGCAGTMRWFNNSTESSLTVLPTATTSYAAYCVGTAGCNSGATYAGIAVLPKPTVTITSPAPCNRPLLKAASAWPQMDYRWKKAGALIENQTAATYTAQTEGTYTAELALVGAWIPQPVAGLSSYGLRDVQFVSNDVGFAAGNDHIFLSTTDGGKNWKAQSLPLSGLHFVQDIFFLNADQGWVLTQLYDQHTDLLRTTDGGLTWKKTKIPIREMKSVFFTSALVGWCVGNNASILKTTDGGATWTSQAGTFGSLSNIFFLDALHGWAGGYYGKLLTTSDGGATWLSRTIGNVAAFNSIHFTSLSNGWTVFDGKNGFYRTTDGGNTWNQVILNVNNDVHPERVQFVNDSTGFVQGQQFIHATTDGGLSWKKSYHNQAGLGMSFTDATHGWVIGGSIMTYVPATFIYASAPVTVLPAAIAPLKTLASGNWNTSSVWSCGTIPTALDAVIIDAPHSVVLPESYFAKAKSVDLRGQIQYNANAGLQLGQE